MGVAWFKRLSERTINIMTDNKLLLIIVAILLPPLAVAMKDGVGKSLVINIILTLLFYIPGLIHALMVIL